MFCIITIIFLSDEFNKLEYHDFIEKFKNDQELIKLKAIQKEILLDGCQLSLDILDSRGNQICYGHGEMRGGEKYIPPDGWIGYGLNVLDTYDKDTGINKNNWI